MSSLLTLPPVSRVAFDMEVMILTLLTMRRATSGVKELFAQTVRGCLLDQPDELCGFLDVRCSLICPRWKADMIEPFSELAFVGRVSGQLYSDKFNITNENCWIHISRQEVERALFLDLLKK